MITKTNTSPFILVLAYFNREQNVCLQIPKNSPLSSQSFQQHNVQFNAYITTAQVKSLTGAAGYLLLDFEQSCREEGNKLKIHSSSNCPLVFNCKTASIATHILHLRNKLFPERVNGKAIPAQA
jgi:hypothetical protein